VKTSIWVEKERKKQKNGWWMGERVAEKKFFFEVENEKVEDRKIDREEEKQM
jgi:hypothetical protein